MIKNWDRYIYNYTLSYLHECIIDIVRWMVGHMLKLSYSAMDSSPKSFEEMKTAAKLSELLEMRKSAKRKKEFYVVVGNAYDSNTDAHERVTVRRKNRLGVWVV